LFHYEISSDAKPLLYILRQLILVGLAAAAALKHDATLFFFIYLIIAASLMAS